MDSRLSFHAGGLRAECLILWECSQRAACSSGRDRFQLRVLGGYSLSAQLADSVLLMVFQGEYLLTHWSHSFGAAVMADGLRICGLHLPFRFELDVRKDEWWSPLV